MPQFRIEAGINVQFTMDSRDEAEKAMIHMAKWDPHQIPG